ncbi:hypothetical protein PG997_006896 [Apiospora hydei]|uniref:Uncharacterized protein n=1 Tax=Apiospora hydei TaxID=1337664 RepID=A0ABR1WRX2_9PEZI
MSGSFDPERRGGVGSGPDTLTRLFSSMSLDQLYIALRRGDEVFHVARQLLWNHCHIIKEQAGIGIRSHKDLRGPITLPWSQDEVATEAIEWFFDVLHCLAPEHPSYVAVDIFGPDETRVASLVALARLAHVAELFKCNAIQHSIRRAAPKLLGQLRLPTDNDAATTEEDQAKKDGLLVQAVRDFDAAYHVWADALLRHWIVAKFCKLFGGDFGRVMSLEPAVAGVSAEFREKTLAWHQRQVGAGMAQN